MWLAPGMLSVVDLSSMTVVSSITKADGSDIRGEIKSAPLVSVRDDEAYVYFTSNKVSNSFDAGGGVYVYRLGDAQAKVLFQPKPDMVQYCMASVICDEEGNLYYTNDSGHLFKIAGNGPAQGGDGGSGGGETGGNGGETGGNGGETGGNGGETGGGNGGETGGNGGQTDNGGQAGGGYGGGQSDSNSGAGTTGAPTTGNTNSAAPPSKIPVNGSVPAGAAPIAKGASDKKDVSPREGTADSDSGDKSQTAGSVAVSESASTVEATAANGMSLPARVAFMAGVVGVAGLVTSGLWMAVSRRR